MTRYTITALAALMTMSCHAATLTCQGKLNTFPPGRQFSSSGTYEHRDDTPKWPGVSVHTDTGFVCTPADCEVIVRITDTRGTAYAKPVYTSLGTYGAWVSPTSIPTGSSLTLTIWVWYYLKPADGSTVTANNAYGYYRNVFNYPSSPASTHGAKLAVSTGVPPGIYTYQTPDQHSFGDLAPGTAGAPLVLPPQSIGSLTTKVFWSGPSGTAMTSTIGATAPTDIRPGTATSLITGGKGLQLDLDASKTSRPGAITGNLTLTLTCP